MRSSLRALLVPIALASSITLVPSAAHAKGVVDVTVRIERDGPGRTLRMDRDDRAVDSVGLAMATHFSGGVGGSSLGVEEVAAPTDERLGPRYVAVFRTHRSRDEVVRIHQDLYPFAELGPLVFTPPEQGWEVSGWHRVGWDLIDRFGDLGIAPPADARWRTVFTAARDFALTIPSSWHRVASPPASNGIEPIVVVGSNSVSAGGPGGCVGRTDAVVSVLRYRRPAQWTADTYMPDRFGDGTPWRALPSHCADSSAPQSVRALRFPLHGARLQVEVAVGAEADAVTKANAYRALDSLREGRRQPRVSRPLRP